MRKTEERGRTAMKWRLSGGALAMALSLAPAMMAQTPVIVGSAANFDVSNDTGMIPHGFEIEADGVQPSDCGAMGNGARTGKHSRWNRMGDGDRRTANFCGNFQCTAQLVRGGQRWAHHLLGFVERGGRAQRPGVMADADPTEGAIDPGAMSVANGVVYAGSFSGFMYALDAHTGKILWSFNSGGSVVSGPSIADGVVYWGSGYSHIKPGRGNNKIYAFALK